VVVVAIDGADGPQLVGLDAMTGATVWEVSAQSTPIANTETVVVVRDPAQSQVFSTNPPQVVTTAAPTLRGLDRATGAELWSIPETDVTDTSGVGAARGPAAVDGQTVVLPAGGPPIGGPALVAIDAPTGDLLWDAPMLGHPSAADATVVGVASSAPNATLTSLELATGEPLWTQPGQPSYGELWAIGDGGVYVLDQTGETVAYELDDGTVRWSVQQRLGMPQLVINDGVVLLWETSLAMLSTVDGSVRWALDTPIDSRLMNSAGANSTDVVIAVNSLPWERLTTQVQPLGQPGRGSWQTSTPTTNAAAAEQMPITVVTFAVG
jgi:outer membrane protein assembly factor BamB